MKTDFNMLVNQQLVEAKTINGYCPISVGQEVNIDEIDKQGFLGTVKISRNAYWLIVPFEVAATMEKIENEP
jgi:hypothetical protein